MILNVFFLKKIIFQNRYVELETPPLHGENHLKFPFWLFDYPPNLHTVYSSPGLMTKDLFTGNSGGFFRTTTSRREAPGSLSEIANFSGLRAAIKPMGRNWQDVDWEEGRINARTVSRLELTPQSDGFKRGWYLSSSQEWHQLWGQSELMGLSW